MESETVDPGSTAGVTGERGGAGAGGGDEGGEFDKSQCG